MHSTTKIIVDLKYETAILSYLAKSLPKFRSHAIKNPATRLAELSIIHLRGPKILDAPTNYGYDLQYTDCEDRPLMAEFPEAKSLVNFLKGQLELKQIGNIMMSVMEPGAYIEPHQDPGKYFEYYRRIHVPIISDPECKCYSIKYPITAGVKMLETTYMEVGTAWELNNCDLHWFHHKGAKPRYHLVFDAL